MKYAVLAGVLLVAAALLGRIATPEPYADAESYAALHAADSAFTPGHEGVPTPTDALFHTLPGQAVLVALAAITLLCMSAYYGDEAFIALLATSPAFLTTFTTVGPAALGVTLIAVGAVLLRNKQYWSVVIIPLCFWLHFSLGILASITFITIALMTNKPFAALGASFFSLVSGVTIALTSGHIDVGLRLPNVSEFIGTTSGAQGVTIFLVFLGIIGFLLQWSTERRVSQLAALLIVPCALLFEHGQIIFAALLALYASRAFDYLWTREWDFEELRTLTIILIVSGVLFTTIIVERERLSVDSERVDVTEFVAAAYPPGTPFLADRDIVGILLYHGYRVAELTPEADADTLVEYGYEYVVTRNENRFTLPVAYHRDDGYTIYTAPPSAS